MFGFTAFTIWPRLLSMVVTSCPQSKVRQSQSLPNTHLKMAPKGTVEPAEGQTGKFVVTLKLTREPRST